MSNIGNILTDRVWLTYTLHTTLNILLVNQDHLGELTT